MKNWSVFNRKSEPAEQLEYLIYLSLVRITSTGRIGEFQVWCFTGKRFAERHFSNSNNLFIILFRSPLNTTRRGI
jgi:hypothetical protein